MRNDDVTNVRSDFALKVLECFISLVALVFLISDSGGNIAREAVLYMIPVLLETIKSSFDWRRHTKLENYLDAACYIFVTVIIVIAIIGCTKVWVYGIFLPIYYIRCIAFAIRLFKQLQ